MISSKRCLLIIMMLINSIGWAAKLSELDPPPPPELHRWLEYRESLTELGRARCPDINVKLLQQGWSAANEREITLLNTSANQVFYTREIFMQCGNKPWWYARTVLPEKTYKVREKAFNELGTNALGTLLYDDPSMQRSPFVFEKLLFDDPLIQRIDAFQPALATAPLYARLSVIHLSDQPLLLQEVFLTPFVSVLTDEH